MSGTIGIIFGILVIIGAVVLLVKQYETRMVLLGAGFLMAIAALKPMIAFEEFSRYMVQGGLIMTICSALGFAAVLQLTKCDKHLVFAMAKGLKYIRPFLIPAVALATFLINIAIPSAAGCAAATGVIMIPLMMSQGVHPATAASAIMLGTFGSMLSPGLSHNPIIAGLATTSLGHEFTSLDVIKTMLVPTVVSFGIGAFCLTVFAKFLKEDKGYVAANVGTAEEQETKNFKVNPLFAILPLIPIFILVAFSLSGRTVDDQTKSVTALKVIDAKELQFIVANQGTDLASTQANFAALYTKWTEQQANTKNPAKLKTLEANLKMLAAVQTKLPNVFGEKMSEQQFFETTSFLSSWGWTKKFGVPHAMLLGAFLCLFFTRTSPSKATKDFFNGMGKGYGDVIGIIICAGVFVGGMGALGLIEAATDAMENATAIAGLAATYGPFLLGIVSGSGDAAALAFNGAVTPSATGFGFQVANMGSLAALAGALGRTMSPLAGAAILCAGLAQVNPFEIAKRNAPGMILASIAAMVLLLYV